MRLRHVLSLDLMKGYRSFQIILQQNKITKCQSMYSKHSFKGTFEKQVRCMYISVENNY